MENKILFVDDNELTRELLFETLSSQGFNVTLAENGNTALTILKDSFFPLIILDLMMPDMDGIELCSHIRKTNSASVIYAYSAAADKFDQDEMDRIGFDGIIFKPSDNTLLLQAVEGAFEQFHMKKAQNSDLDYP